MTSEKKNTQSQKWRKKINKEIVIRINPEKVDAASSSCCKLIPRRANDEYQDKRCCRSPREASLPVTWLTLAQVFCLRCPGKRYVSALLMSLPRSNYVALSSFLLYYQVRSFSFAFRLGHMKMVQPAITLIIVSIIAGVSHRPACSNYTFV